MKRRHHLYPIVVVALIASACTSTTEPTTTTTAAEDTTSTAPRATTTTIEVARPAPADVVLHNAKVITVDADFSIAEAVAITDGDIVAVGSSSDVLAYAGTNTTVVDLEGKTLIPGFVDPHTHALQHLAFNSDLDAMSRAQQDLLRGGTTTTGAPTVTPADLEGYRAFEAEGRVIVRNHLYLAYNDPCGERPYGDHYLTGPFSHDPELRQTVAGAKIFSDGGVCNAFAISEPFLDSTPDNLKERGFTDQGNLYVTADEVASVVGAVDAAGGITVIHAIGDEANRTVLRGMIQAQEQATFANPQRIDHNSLSSLLTADELAMYGQLDMVPVVFPVPWANGCDPATAAAWRAILPDRIYQNLENSAPLRDANPDLQISWHGDSPSVPGHPLQLMFSIVTGGFVDIDSGTTCLPDDGRQLHVVPVEEAYRMFTVNAAAAMGIDDRVGSIEVGKVADLVVLKEDPLGPDHEVAIATNHPLMTMVDGLVHFCEWDLCDRFGDLLVIDDSPVNMPTVEGLTMTASASREGHPPELVFDGSVEGDSFWSSGADPPGWIKVDFDVPQTVRTLRFVVFQNPASDTTHVLEIRVDGEWIEVEQFVGFTSTGDILEWTSAEPVTGVESFRVTTLESLSWPEWYEIELDIDG